MQFNHTAHAIYHKFGMTHLTSHARQHLLLKASTNVSWPVTTKLCSLWSHNQDHRPWQQVHQYLLVQKGLSTGQFLPLHRLVGGSPRHPAQGRHELLFPSRFFLFSKVHKVEMLFTTPWHLTSFTIVFQRAAHLLR